MLYERNIDWIHRRRIICRRDPIHDKPTKVYKWGNYYEHGTYEFFDLFRTEAKINTFKSLKWHLLVIWYLNPNISSDELKEIVNFVSEKTNGFVTFNTPAYTKKDILSKLIEYDLDLQPKNKMRKIIFNQFCGLTKEEKLKIVGSIIGRKNKKITEDYIYECMLGINASKEIITISKIASLMSCSNRTVLRAISDELREEKRILNEHLL
ncbi:hypothetical protein N8371_08890 [Vicingaceae bacterium]|nr:hypothetical protein [Vicingaceae bacterium]